MRTKLFFICMACLLMAWSTNAQTVVANATVATSAGNLKTDLSAIIGTYMFGGNDLLNPVENLTITGTLNAKDFVALKSSQNSLLSVDLSGITKIEAYSGTDGPAGSSVSSYPANEFPENVFYNYFKRIQTVIFPNNAGMTSIGKSAFYNCTALSAITIPEGVTSVKGSAFSNCTGTTTLKLPSTLKTVEASAFNGLTMVPELTLPNGLVEIGDQAFYSFKGISTLTIPSSVRKIGKEAFAVMLNCASITFQHSSSDPVMISGNGTFRSLGYYATEPLTFTFPENSTIFYDNGDGTTSAKTLKLFSASNIKKIVNFPANVTEISTETFKSCAIESFDIPNGVTAIGQSAFSQTTKLTSLSLPNSVKTIGTNAFLNATGFTSINLGMGIESIGDRAFSGVTGVSSLELPATLQSIGSEAFKNMTVLISLRANGTFPVTLSSDPFSGVNKTACTLYVPAEALEAYQQADYWKTFTHIEGFAIKQNQTITGLSDITKTVTDADFDLTATATSGLAITYASSNTAVATISGSTVHIVGAGTTTITASQAGNNNYSAATDVTATLTVNKASQTITGLSDMTKTYGDADFTLSANSSSSLPVTYTIQSNVVTINGSTIHITGAGTAIITASQAGNDSFNAATPVTATLTVSKADQGINFTDITKTYGDASFELGAVSGVSSGLRPILFTIADPSIATIRINSIDIVDILKAGTTTITAMQAGNENYNPVSRTVALTVNKASQTISGLSDMSKNANDVDFTLSAIASSGLALTYSSSNTSVATIKQTTVEILQAGTTTITASQAGNDNYNAATDVTATLTVAPIDGLNDVRTQLPVRIQNGNIIVSAESGSTVDVFNAIGIKLQSQTANSAETTLSNLPQSQVLIVRSGNAVAKVIL